PPYRASPTSRQTWHPPRRCRPCSARRNHWSGPPPSARLPPGAVGRPAPEAGSGPSSPPPAAGAQPLQDHRTECRDVAGAHGEHQVTGGGKVGDRVGGPFVLGYVASAGDLVGDQRR